MPLAEHSFEVMQCFPAVQNVFHDNQVPAFQRDIQIFHYFNHTGGFYPGTVAGNHHKINLAGNLNGAHQVAHEYDRAFEHTDQKRIFSCIVLGNPLTHLPHLFGQSFRGIQNRLDVFSHSASSSMSITKKRTVSFVGRTRSSAPSPYTQTGDSSSERIGIRLRCRGGIFCSFHHFRNGFPTLRCARRR